MPFLKVHVGEDVPTGVREELARTLREALVAELGVRPPALNWSGGLPPGVPDVRPKGGCAMNAGPGSDRVRLLLDQMDYTQLEGGWFPPTRRTLAGLTAAQACHRASGAAMTHTIRELVSHLAFWKETCARALRGLPRHAGRIENDATFGETGDPADEPGWRAALDRLARADAVFREAVAGLAEDDLDPPLSPGDASARELVSALNVHDGYHLGQIALLAKLAGGSGK